jgi:regulator of sigma E protease
MDLHYLIVAPVFLLMVTVLVAAHEYGHYLFAKLNGMDVEEFAIGLGTPRWVWMRRAQNKALPTPSRTALPGGQSALPEETVEQEPESEIEFTVRPLPVGGFVRIKGMMPQDDGSETLVPNGFYSKSPLRRLSVLFAGPLFSVLAGIILLVGLFIFVGKPTLEKPIIGGVLGGTPAEQAGLKAGDRIVALDGKPIQKWFQIKL